MHHLLPLFKWFDQSAVGAWIADSAWLFPAIEAVHIVALTLLLGAILMLNLRLLGLVLIDKPVRHLAGSFAPWVLCSLLIILGSGVLLFSSEAMKSYTSVPFQVKMVFLAAAILFHYTVYSRLTNAAEGRIRPVWYRVAAVISITLWLGVGIAGRGIGFL